MSLTSAIRLKCHNCFSVTWRIKLLISSRNLLIVDHDDADSQWTFSSFRVDRREEAHAVRSSTDAAAWPELLRPLPGGVHQRLQPQSPDASLELLHRRQASKKKEYRKWKCSNVFNPNPVMLSNYKIWTVHSFMFIQFLIINLQCGNVHLYITDVWLDIMNDFPIPVDKLGPVAASDTRLFEGWCQNPSVPESKMWRVRQSRKPDARLPVPTQYASAPTSHNAESERFP